MRWFALLLATVLLAGCGGSGDDSKPGAQSTDAGTDTSTDVPPRSYEELLERIPPFDVPASPEVSAYREATIGAFFDRCVNDRGADVEKTFVKANRALLDKVPVFPGAKLAHESSIDHRDFNGCPEGLGPPTSYTTYRRFDLPSGTPSEQVFRFYDRILSDWTGGALTSCERSYSRGEALLYLSACTQEGTRCFEINVRALERRPSPKPPKLPPRPYGAQYPAAENHRDIPEPTSYEVEPGETCERTSGGDVPSIIIPPTPGIRAEWTSEPAQLGEHVVVEWSFDKILGDCPPTQLHLTLPNPASGNPPFGIHVDVSASSGTKHLSVPDSFREAYVLWAFAASVDGHQSRSVAVLIGRR